MSFEDTETFKQIEASFWDFDSTPNFDPIGFFVKKDGPPGIMEVGEKCRDCGTVVVLVTLSNKTAYTPKTDRICETCRAKEG